MHVDVAFRVLAGNNRPHFTNLNEFRRCHRHAFAHLFAEVLSLCMAAGMVNLGHIAIDGTKIKADASKHKAMTYERMTQEEQRLVAEIEAMLLRSDEVDAADDARYGEGRRAFELPHTLKHRQGRLDQIRAVKARMERQASEARAEQLRANAASKRASAQEHGGRQAKALLTKAHDDEAKANELAPKDDDQPPPSAPTDLQEHHVRANKDGKPKPDTQMNFTDPDSCIMVGRDGFIQAYNAQAAVDAQHQIIVAVGLTNQPPDSANFAPMAHRVVQNTARVPTCVSADTGYWSEQSARVADQLGFDALIPLGRTKRWKPGDGAPNAPPGTDADDLSPRQRMDDKMKTETAREQYKLRGRTIEAVFGQIKEPRGFRQFSFRGLHAVAAESNLVTLCHNVLKLWRRSLAPV